MQPVLILHGAIGAKDQLQPLANALSTDYTVHLLNFSGHGGTPAKNEFSIAAFAEEVFIWIKENAPGNINIIGYSMGGYVAMYLALRHPDVISKIVTLGTKFLWTEEIAAREVAMLNPEVIETKVPKFAAQLQQRHHPAHWKSVVKNTADMLHSMGKEPPLKGEEFASIQNEILVLLGDRDKMVSLDETVQVYKQLPKAQLAILPNTPHPIELVDEKLVAFLVNRFLRL